MKETARYQRFGIIKSTNLTVIRSGQKITTTSVNNFSFFLVYWKTDFFNWQETDDTQSSCGKSDIF